MGARYMTLTHSCDTPWAEAAQQEANGQGLSLFGERVVMEMNRIGMMVDLAHVSRHTMADALRVSSAPVIFSHSGARGVNNNVRNVPDNILLKVKANGGIVMVNFYACYLIKDCKTRNATLADVVNHIEHIRLVAGVEHIGLGSDFNGVSQLPIGLQDVSGYPNVSPCH
jgi:membrane dipeptidase